MRCVARLTAAWAVGTLGTLATEAQADRIAMSSEVSEVVVTARRIEEKLQTVPISIQVISGEHLEETGVTRLFDLQYAVPGLVVNTVGMFGAGFSMRGISDQQIAGLAVAPHLNGVYLGDANLAIARMFDVERIEVLKGPQGALYGRSATAGSMNFITRSPQDEFSADVEVGYGSFDTTRTQGHLNLPVQAASFRIAFLASEGDGYIRNSVDDRTFGEEDYWGLRAAWRIETSEGLSIDVMAQHIRDDGASSELWTPQVDLLLDPHDIRLTTVTLANPYLISETDNVSVNVVYDFGFATLRSITGYARSNVRNLDDCAGNPFLQGCVRGASPAQYDQWSQELQFIFPRKNSVDGLVGAYFADAEEFLHFHLTLPVVSPLPFSDYRTTSKKPAAAAFGQATLHLNEGWSVTAGARLNWEEQSMTSIGTGLTDIPPVVGGEDDWSDVSWRLDVQRALREDIMLYASVATGLRSGGFLLTTLPNGEADSFDPEHVTAYELGAKTRGWDRRLTFNAAAFFNDFDDLQVTTADFSQDPPFAEVSNAARAEVYGLDVGIAYQPLDGFSITAGAVWLPKREFVRFIDDSGADQSGNELVRAPEWTATGAITYEKSLLQFGALSSTVEYSYRSGFFYTPDNNPAFAQDGFGLLNLFLRFESAKEDWYVFASGRNLTDEDYFTQAFIQSTPGYPDTYEFGVGVRF